MGTVIVRRIDLVVPSGLVTNLQIPSLAITDGAADPDWVEVPLGRWRFKRQPSLRLPLDPRSAKNTRRYVRLAPWSPLPALVALVAWSVSVFGDLSWPASLVAIVVAVGAPFTWSLLKTGGLPRQVPYRTRFGDLRIPEVPVEVAREWVAQNQGVTATNEAAPRPHSRRFYAAWTVGLLLAAVGLVVVLANNGREDFILLWMLAPVLFFTGVSMALKTQPPAKPGIGHIWPS
ncbi:hypothetical protein [Actinoplanes sp. NPDC049118]|uniref:hypothetical protein n=1 Tax=Actinoplanes sp. NPDC049118 TaxID=3155769 RepID=UPI0033C96D90